ADDALVHAELAAHLDHLARGLLPQHPGAAARVAEALDEGLDAAVAALAIEAAQHAVPDRRAQAQALDALRRPVGGNVVARHAPALLGVGTKEDRIEPLAELVAHPFVERARSLDRPELRPGVRQDAGRARQEPEVPQRLEGAQRVRVEFSAVVDAG